MVDLPVKAAAWWGKMTGRLVEITFQLVEAIGRLVEATGWLVEVAYRHVKITYWLVELTLLLVKLAFRWVEMTFRLAEVAFRWGKVTFLQGKVTFRWRYRKKRPTPAMATKAPTTSLAVTFSLNRKMAAGMMRIGIIDMMVEAMPVEVC